MISDCWFPSFLFSSADFFINGEIFSDPHTSKDLLLPVSWPAWFLRVMICISKSYLKLISSKVLMALLSSQNQVWVSIITPSPFSCQTCQTFGFWSCSWHCSLLATFVRDQTTTQENAISSCALPCVRATSPIWINWWLKHIFF